MREIKIALAGQPNVGKSVIFNNLTGLHQHIGNWPGKTVERAEGTLYYRGHFINVIDLPGIYSLTCYSLEEQIAREFITRENPDVIVNIVDATTLERQLIFTIQLLELERPMVLVLNMMDLAEKRGIRINHRALEAALGTPVIPTVATQGKGLTKILDKVIQLPKEYSPKRIEYGHEVESRIQELMKILDGLDLPCPRRWIAIKLLEKDEEVWRIIKEKAPDAARLAEKMISELEGIHGHDSSIVISNERVSIAHNMAQSAVTMIESEKLTLGDRFDKLATHPVLGYLIMALFFIGISMFVFGVGLELSGFMEEILSESLQDLWFNYFGKSLFSSLGWSAVEGFIILLALAVPFIAPLYIILFTLESWGYLARVSFLLDSLMHRMGIHGKACIPLILGFGCNVPACLSSRIMETWRERLITIFMVTLMPCSAVTVVIMGLVGINLGIHWALGLYIFTLLMAFMLGGFVSRVLPGEAVELIMEVPSYRWPSLKTILLMTWIRLKEYIYIAMPLVIISGVLINTLESSGLLEAFSEALSPVTVGWLNLPKEVGAILLFGVLRKELILLTLASLIGTINFSTVLTANQMVTLALITIFYIPCVATIAALVKEIGVKRAGLITIGEILLAILIGGIASRILFLLGVT
ncbi:MAG: ferrous iron transport protein B [Aigarchaeota archaeon]|nr:ferrous iron transport protein B [Aigarchaeota archaeon]